MKMVEAFILIRVKPGSEIVVRDELENLLKSEEIYMLYGEWDFLVKVKESNLKRLKDFVVSKIRTIEGVLDTSTLIVAEGLEEDTEY
ncbi:MAG TPA: Lrp/AsnC family transcriptional regulator [Nautiliaceae bacterium]|nr:Lrp/AsnC family transcriptional regulator [Nautiliaceae bacterium]